MKNLAYRRSRSSVTLVMVLLAMALMAILVLSLLTGSIHQIRGAVNDASYSREKMLADTAVALVIGQIRAATTQTNVVWISQPGLLRTYDTTASRVPTACYKLYSATQEIDTSGTLAFLSNDVPSDWSASSNASVYTDLNASQNTSGLFPETLYPILDPAAVTNVTGVSIDTGYTQQMPVAWLYQLQDGTLGPASKGTKANPIVARLAFWTDDETCKVNINTAGYGAPWNSPHANSTNDVQWSTNQPASGEYSSYPGHPAMTSLYSVFGTNSLTPEQLLALSPRYNYGGSEFGTVGTTAGETVAAKTDRLYSSIDELCFGTGMSSSSQREANPLTATQIEVARFVLTAHSQAPETTMLGEPRFAIWPISDQSSSTNEATEMDRAVMSAATVGTGTTNVRDYFFERDNAQSMTNDLSSTITPGNVQFFDDLITRGNATLPGTGASFSQKYTGSTWTQLMLEILDYIRGINAVDPSASPFVPYAAGGTSNVGVGFIEPLTTTYGTGTNQITLRGLGRCPTLSSLTLVFYVSGFGFSDGTSIDYETSPDTLAGSSWKTNFAVGSSTNRWKKVNSELVRAFVVPCTFQPGCAYPEVSDACDIQISGLNNIQVSSGSSTGGFGFAATTNSRLFSDALTVPTEVRSWGGNEGPLAWRAAALDAMANKGTNYPFAGTNAFVLPLAANATLDPLTGGPSLPASWTRAMTFNAVTNLTVHIRDRNATVLQTLNVSLPAFSVHAPTINGECDHYDGSTPATANVNWATSTNNFVYPSYYMTLRNRLLATQNSRSFFIQAGDISRSVEANNDLRVIAGLATVPATLFHTHPSYLLNSSNTQGGSPAHNLRFENGSSACFASGTVALVSLAAYPYATNSMTPLDWRTGTASSVPYTWVTSPPCSAPTGTNAVTMAPIQSLSGDWDTGPGFAPDGAQINLPDSGTTNTPSAAYFSLTGGGVGAATQRTPNALVPSPVVFGSLPAGINPSNAAQSEPWRTLLFCPYPAANTNSTPYAIHPGATSPADYLILDNFWMPVVEPYSISTCMTTAGKINLNDQIAPFTYIHRNTALHALLTDLRIPAIPYSAAASYKTSGTPIASIWNTVDENATISQIENRFANGSVNAYLTEGEICSVPLVPLGEGTNTVAATQAALETFWNGPSGAGRLTGDNLRELPYAQLYGRLTTRSNSYTVHVRVQVLQKLPNDPQQNVWNEGTDLILGDWRGSYEIERYLDPSAAAPLPGKPLGPYKYRIVSCQRFAP